MEKKRISLMVCVLAIALIAGVAQAQDFTTNLVAHWELDETSGPTAADSVGSLHGTLVGGPTWVGGVVDGAIDFDSADADDARYVDCGDGAALDITGDRSIAAWFRVDNWNVQYWAGLVTKGRTDGSYSLLQGRLYDEDKPGHSGRGSDHGIAFQVKGINQHVYNPDGSYAYKSQQVVRGSVPVDDGLWHLAVGTFEHDHDDGLAHDVGRYAIYVDGVLDADYIIGSGETVTNDDSFWLNGQYTNPVFPNSSLDDVRVYDRALSADDISALYDATVPEPATMVLLGLGSLTLLRRRRA